MADVTAIGTNQTPWNFEELAPAATTLASRGDLAHVTAEPAATGMFVLPLPTGADVTNAIALAFYSDGAASAEATVRVWGLSKITGGGTNERLGDWLADLAITLGTNAPLSGGVFSTPAKRAVHDIAVDEDRTNNPPGIRLVGDVTNALAAMIFDTMGFSEIVVQFQQSTPDEWAPLWRAF